MFSGGGGGAEVFSVRGGGTKVLGIRGGARRVGCVNGEGGVLSYMNSPLLASQFIQHKYEDIDKNNNNKFSDT